MDGVCSWIKFIHQHPIFTHNKYLSVENGSLDDGPYENFN